MRIDNETSLPECPRNKLIYVPHNQVTSAVESLHAVAPGANIVFVRRQTPHTREFHHLNWLRGNDIKNFQLHRDRIVN